MAVIHTIVPKQFRLFIEDYTFVLIWLGSIVSNVFAWNLLKFIKAPSTDLYGLKYSVIFGTIWVDSLIYLKWILISGLLVIVFNFVCSYLTITRFRMLAVWWAVSGMIYNLLLLMYTYVLSKIQ